MHNLKSGYKLNYFNVGDTVYYPTSDGMYLLCIIHAYKISNKKTPIYYVSNWVGFEWVYSEILTLKKPNPSLVKLPV